MAHKFYVQIFPGIAEFMETEGFVALFVMPIFPTKAIVNAIWKNVNHENISLTIVPMITRYY